MDLAPRKCIDGYDVARSFALLGMVLVHFALVMASNLNRPAWLAHFIGFPDGCATATFLVLAGIGVTPQARKATELKRPQRSGCGNCCLRRGAMAT